MKKLPVAVLAAFVALAATAQEGGPPGTGGSVPIDDTDGDTVPDNDDNCRYERGPPENGGCPWRVETVKVKGKRIGENLWENWKVLCPDGATVTTWWDCAWYPDWQGAPEINFVFTDEESGEVYGERRLTMKVHKAERMAQCIVSKTGDLHATYDTQRPLAVGLPGNGQHIVQVTDKLTCGRGDHHGGRPDGCAVRLEATVDNQTYVGYVTQVKPAQVGNNPFRLWDTLVHEIGHHVSGDYGHRQGSDWWNAVRDIKRLAKDCK